MTRSRRRNVERRSSANRSTTSRSRVANVAEASGEGAPSRTPPADTREPEAAVWSSTRAGARAGRGFHYQDVVGAWLCAKLLSGELNIDTLVPEGLDDLSCEGGEAWQIQVKSRQEQVGDFSPRGVAEHLLDLVARHELQMEQGLARVALVLERPVKVHAGSPSHLGPLGARVRDLPVDHALRDALRVAGERRGWSADHTDRLAGAASVVVLPWSTAVDETRQAVEARHGLFPGAAQPVVRVLRDTIAAASDANGASNHNERTALARTDVARIVEQTVALIDSSSLDRALREGLCEPVDFDTPIAGSRFFEGVEVQAGHIAAGLPAPRPGVTGQVVAAMDSGAAVLVTGPSGVGKSTVLWSAAYSARHVLWYRVRRLAPQDVDALVRLARACQPTDRSPVGFVVDGVTSSLAWDELQRELAPVAFVRLLGSARTEDLLLLQTLPACTTVEVRLDEEVAAQLHAGLLANGATQVPHWREAFEASSGLTLEFTYLLTQGRRLADVLFDQVRQRVVGDRGLELQILALVATAHRWSSPLALRRVQHQLDASSTAFSTALGSLADEHLVHESSGRLTGLHQLRSHTLSEAVHAFPPPLLFETVDTVIQLLDDEQLQVFTIGALIEVPELDEVVLARLVQELATRANAAAWTAVLEALRLVDFARRASRWDGVLDRHEVEPAFRPVVFQLAIARTEAFPGTRPEVTAALTEIAEDERQVFSPLRDALLARVGGPAVAAALGQCVSMAATIRFLAALQDAPDEVVSSLLAPGTVASVVEILDSASADEFGEFLSAAGEVSPEFAEQLFNAAGGDNSIQALLRARCPWLVELTVIEDGSQCIARARLLHISDADQPDVEKYVRRFAATLLRCYPRCSSVDVQALLPGSLPIQFRGFVTGMSRLARRYDHPPAAVAWNRRRIQMAVIGAGTTDATTRASVAQNLVAETADYCRNLTRIWCLSRYRPGEAEALIQEGRALSERAGQLRPAVQRASGVDPATERDVPAPKADSLLTLAQGVTDNLTTRLFGLYSRTDDRTIASRLSTLTAFVGDTLRKAVATVRREERWDLLGTGEPPELDLLDSTLVDLHAVLAEMAWGQLTGAEVANRSRSGPSERALRRAAETARSRAAARAEQELTKFCASAREEGLIVAARQRDLPNADAVIWPAVETAVMVPFVDLVGWLHASERLPVLLARDAATKGASAPILVSPTVEGRPLRILTQRFQSTLMPNPDLLDRWSSALPESFPTPLTDAVVELHHALQACSGFAELVARRADPTLLGLPDRAAARVQRAWHLLNTFDDADPVIAHVVEVLGEITVGVLDEVEGRSGTATTFAAGVMEGLTVAPNDDSATLDWLLTICLTWDVGPPAARRLLANGSQGGTPTASTSRP